MLKKLVGLSGKAFLGDEIDRLHVEVKEKRLIQTAITIAAIMMPITAVIAPKQPNEIKLGELGLGTILGGASAYVARMREEIESRYESTLRLNREVFKKETINRFAKEQVISDVSRDVSVSNALAANLNPHAVLEYAQRLQLPRGLFADILPTLTSSNHEENNTTVNQLQQIGIAKPNADLLELHINKSTAALIRNLAKQYPDYIKIDGQWILDLINSSSAMPMKKRANHHYMISAETQAGKSTLAGVFARGIAERSEKPAVIAGHDAKKIPGKKDITRWLCDFTYKLDGYQRASDWAKLMESLGAEQLDLVSESGGGCEGVRELIIIQDEHNTVFGKGKGYGKLIDSDTALDLQAQWLFVTTNLAGAKGHGIFMGQSPLSGDTGFSIPAMNNTCFIAMGETSGYILEGTNRKNYIRNVSDDVIRILSETCELFQKEGLRYALVRPTRGNPFIAIIPEFDVESIGKKEEPKLAFEETPEQKEQIDPIRRVEKPSSTPDLETKFDVQQVFLRMKEWVEQCRQQLGVVPSKSDIKKAWYEETGQDLSDAGLTYIMEKLGLV